MKDMKKTGDGIAFFGPLPVFHVPPVKIPRPCL